VISRIRDRTGGVELVAGGGVGGQADLRALAEAGCNGALVSTALLEGRRTPIDIQQL